MPLLPQAAYAPGTAAVKPSWERVLADVLQVLHRLERRAETRVPRADSLDAGLADA